MMERDCYRDLERRLGRPEVLVVTGMRRVGKTTLLKHLYDRTASDNKVFIDLENPTRRRMFESADYDAVRDAIEALGIDWSKRAWVFLDEIQYVRQIPSAVKYLYDHFKVKFVLTGSASFYMKNLFAESLSGRKRLVEMHPLSFAEFLRFKGGDAARLKLPKPGRASPTGVFDLFTRHYAEYVEYGGFPQVVLEKRREDKRAALEDIFASYYEKQILGIGDFRRNNAVRDLMLLVLARVGSKLDISKLSSELGISRPTLMDYLAFLEGTYFFHAVKPFSRGRDTEIRGQAKIYACDTGLANCLGSIAPGALFENAVYLALRPRGTVHYYQRTSGVEIDFVVNRREAYEAKLTARAPDIRRLARVARELRLKPARVVSRTHSSLPGAVPPFAL